MTARPSQELAEEPSLVGSVAAIQLMSAHRREPVSEGLRTVALGLPAVLTGLRSVWWERQAPGPAP